MKSASITMLFLLAAGNAIADAPYKHEYENGGHFAGIEEAKVDPKQARSYKREYENGAHFESEAQAPASDAQNPENGAQLGAN